MFIVGIKTVILPAILTFGNPRESDGWIAKDVYYFISLFRIPIIPIWYKMPVYRSGYNYIKRGIPIRGYLINFIIPIVGIGLILIIIAILSDSGVGVRKFKI